MAKADLTAQLLRELLHYDQETGVFTRIVRTSNRINVGAVAGTRRPDGYLKISLLDSAFLAHRLAWLYVTGDWPKWQIDHINGVRSDNRWANLRDVPPYVNQGNQRVAHAKNKSSGLLGVTWNARKNKWAAQISATGKQIHIGLFDRPEDAHAAYLDAKRRLHEGCTI